MLKTKKAAFTVARMWADSVHTKFVDSLANLLVYESSKLPPGQYIHYTSASMSWHELARNQIVDNSLGDFILMLDTDHVFAPDLLERLLRIKNEVGAEVISGIYCYKFPPHAPVINMWSGSDEKGLRLSGIRDWDRSARVMQVGAVGAGCLVIDRKLLKRMEFELGQRPFDIIPGLSEDYSFCYRLRKMGVPLYLAPQIECHHMIPNILSVTDYAPNEELVGAKAENGIIKVG